MIAPALLLQAQPLPPPVTPELTPETVTRPAFAIACTLRDKGRTGALRLAVTGWRGYRGGDGGVRTTEQQVRVEADELGVFTGAAIGAANLHGFGGDVQFARGKRRDRSHWRFVVVREGGRYRGLIADADARTGFAAGDCTVQSTPQAPLTAEETQRYLSS